MNKTFSHLTLSLVLLCAAMNSIAFASKPSKNSEKSNAVFTDERSRAAGNLSTMIVAMQKMAHGCNSKGFPPEATIKKNISNWQNRNQAYLMIHYEYVNAYLNALKTAESENASKQELTKITKYNNEQANAMVKTMIEKDGVELACKKYFTILASGGMDIKEGYPDFKTWKGMLEYSTKNAPAKK
jgi:hypothetical protein